MLIGTCFRYWGSSGDFSWAAWAWSVLTEAGVVPEEINGEGEGAVDHALTVLAMAYESDLFNEVRATGREEWVHPHDPSDVVDFLDDIALGRWADRHDVAPWVIPESREILLQQCVEQRARVVMRTLISEVGGVEALFLSLWAQSSPHTEYPLSAAAQSRILEECGVDALVTHDWFVRRHS